MERPPLEEFENFYRRHSAPHWVGNEFLDVIAYARYLESVVKSEAEDNHFVNARLDWFEHLLTKLRPAPSVGQPLLGHIWVSETFNRPLDDPYRHPHT